jgi:hypothetical protein
MRRHFHCRHPWDEIIIEEEGELPQCSMCDFFGEVGHNHTASVDCRKYTARRLEATMLQASQEEVVFKVIGVSIEQVKEFKYLGCIIKQDDNDLSAVEWNSKRA